MIKSKLIKSLERIGEKYSKKLATGNNKKAVDSLTKENKELKTKIKALFWNICRQREKVKGNIESLVDMVYTEDKNTKNIVKKRVFSSIEKGIKS